MNPWENPRTIIVAAADYPLIVDSIERCETAPG